MTTVHPGLTCERESGKWVMRGHADAYFDSAKQGEPSNKSNASQREELKGSGSRFFGMTFKEAESLESWADGLELLSHCTMGELPPPSSIKRVSTWSDSGDEFDRDRFDAGIEDCWRTRKRASKPAAQILKLTMAIGGNCHISPEALAWGGAAAVAITDAAEAAGYRIELQAVSYIREATTGNLDLVQAIDVKAADEPVNVDRLMTIVSCPAFFRWHMLATMALCPDTLDSGFGRSIEPPTEYAGDLHIGRCYSRQAAQQAVRNAIAQLESMTVTA